MVAAFPLFAQHGHSLQSGEALAPAAQGAALFMTFVVAAILLSLAAGIFILVRRARRGESPEQALLREVREQSRLAEEKQIQEPEKAEPEPGTPLHDWEKDPDWWKSAPPSDQTPPEKSE
jgi:8-oxo-dGTP pyrophosphatase MutT (NUDIX family)